MKTHSNEPPRHDPERDAAPRPGRGSLPAEGPAKVLEQAGALGNQAFQRQAQGAKDEEGAAQAAPEAAPAPPSSEDPEEVLAKLGDGKAVPAEARRRMEAAFGEDFSDVRLHDDATAAMLAKDLGARAFAVGEHVAMGSGEMQPGTVVGDAILAHELAHVMQQRGDSAGAAKDGPTGSTSAMEEDAETAAGNAVSSLWAGGAISPVDPPRQRSGLRLSRCDGKKTDDTAKKSVTVGITKLEGSNRDPGKDVDYANQKVYNQANVEVKATRHPDLDATKSKAAVGNDLVLDEFTDVKKPTQEEKNLFAINPASGGIATYYVQDLTTNRAESFPPYAGAGVLAAMVGNKSSDSTFAHELGHILMDDDGTMHDEPDVENVMHAPEGSKARYKLTPDQIKKVRSSSVVK